MRNDLPVGVIAAQVAHAAGSGSERHPGNTYVVVLAVGSERELEHVAAQLERHGLAHTLVRESDEPFAGEAMAIGLELQADRRRARRVLSSLPLLRGQVAQAEHV